MKILTIYKCCLQVSILSLLISCGKSELKKSEADDAAMVQDTVAIEEILPEMQVDTVAQEPEIASDSAQPEATGARAQYKMLVPYFDECKGHEKWSGGSVHFRRVPYNKSGYICLELEERVFVNPFYEQFSEILERIHADKYGEIQVVIKYNYLLLLYYPQSEDGCRGSNPYTNGRAYLYIDIDGIPMQIEICDLEALNNIKRMTKNGSKKKNFIFDEWPYVDDRADYYFFEIQGDSLVEITYNEYYAGISAMERREK